MSKSSASSPASCAAAGLRLSARSPYRDQAGTPVRGSRLSPTATMYWASPRTPCSGPKRAASVTPRADASRSAAWRRRASTEVGLQIRPTRRPRSVRKPSAAATSRPDRTLATARLPRRAEREREGEAARLLRRVGGIAEVPVGAGPDRGVLDRVGQDLDEGRDPVRVGRDAD